MNINTSNPVNKTLNLSICGENEVDFDVIKNVATPEASNRWHPIAHDCLVENFRESVKNSDLQIVNEHHALAREDNHYFGMFQVRGNNLSRKHDSEVGTVMCLRNSHDKAFRAGIAAGDAPFVCSNLIFDNEIVLGRRHTTNILRDLPTIMSQAIGLLKDTWQTTDNRITAYKALDLDDKTAHDLIVRSFRAGACTKSQMADVITQWHNPEHEEFGSRDLWSLQNAFTNVYRGGTLRLPRRSQSLLSVLDGHTETIAA